MQELSLSSILLQRNARGRQLYCPLEDHLQHPVRILATFGLKTHQDLATQKETLRNIRGITIRAILNTLAVQQSGARDYRTTAHCQRSFGREAIRYNTRFAGSTISVARSDAYAMQQHPIQRWQSRQTQVHVGADEQWKHIPKQSPAMQVPLPHQP